jgi:predicted PurR-regulated permease PerM
MEFVKDKRLNFIISIAIGLAILFYLLSKLKWLFIYFSFALMLAYFFDPFYRYLIHKKVPKVLAIIIVFGIIITLLILTIVFLIPSVINQLNVLYKEIPNFIENYQNLILSIKPQLSKFINSADVEILLKENLSPLILFYLMRDMVIFKENLYIFVSKENKKEFKEVLEEIDRIVSGFIRGRIIVCFIVGTLIGIGLYFLNLKFALIIGIVSGVFNFIPYLGPIVGVVLALIFALGNPWWSLLMIVILFVLVNQLEAIYLNPSMLICGQLLGILGVLVAVPLAAILKVLAIRHLVQEG